MQIFTQRKDTEKKHRLSEEEMRGLRRFSRTYNSKQYLICKLVVWQFSNSLNYADEMRELSRPANTQCAVRRIKISTKCNGLSVSSRTHHNLGMSHLKNEGPGALT